MSANSEKTAKKRKRGTGKPFEKGQSGNPDGRPKKRKELTQRCQRFIDDEGLDILMDIARNGKNNEKIDSISLIAAYAYGKPDSMSKVEITGKDGGAVSFQWIIKTRE